MTSSNVLQPVIRAIWTHAKTAAKIFIPSPIGTISVFGPDTACKKTSVGTVLGPDPRQNGVTIPPEAPGLTVVVTGIGCGAAAGTAMRLSLEPTATLEASPSITLA
jgi:hypothetical protein